MRRAPLMQVFLASLLCCGCASAPVHFYTLMRPIALPGESTDGACCRVKLGRVTIPPEVDRAELVTRSGEEEAVVLTNAAWLAPLREEIRGALAVEIEFRLRQGIADEPAAKVPLAVLSVNVTRFESVPARYVLVSVNWRVQHDLPKAASFTCETTAQIAVQSGISALVQGYQQVLVTIADTIARDLLRSFDLPPLRDAQCPGKV